jgi:hypothetical protein
MFYVPVFARPYDVPAKEFLVKKTWSLFAFIPLLALTLSVTGCDSGPASDPATDDTSTGDIQLTEEEEAGEQAYSNQ